MTPSPGRGHVVVAVAALVILGAAAGITADRLLNRSPAAHALRLSDGTVLHFSDVHADPIGIIDRVVGLRPEQRTRVAAILERRQADIDAAWQEARTRMQGTVDSVLAEIAGELDPDQAERFRALHDQLYGRHRERHRPH